MSSQEEEEEEHSPARASAPEQSKRKKKQRACDYCRRKKTPADASPMVSAPPVRSSASVAGVSPPPVDPPSPAEEDELEPSEDEREARLNILENFKRLTVTGIPQQMRYHGKSSNMMFLQTVIKQKYPAGSERPKGAALPGPPARVVDFSMLKAVQQKVERPPDRSYPVADLMEKLIVGYFENINIYLPLLHEPTFRRSVAADAHLREPAFGAVLLLVCAIGSRWTDDPRVQTEDGTTPGWCWFTQVDTVRWSIFERPKVEDVQACALIASYLALSNRPQGSWTVMGMGLRMAADVGAHRKKVYHTKPSVEDELWRRAFWTLIYLDRTASFGLGRPGGLHDEDFDLDPMTEVDDEYWENEDPELEFKQPEGKPSKIAFANCLVGLQKILAYASRTIYSINKSKQTLGYVGPEWEQRTVAELDSALNKWIDTVPEHLKWDPNREDDIFMNQSCTLYANYYWLQICIHRPFIQPSKANRLPFPSLTICTNAARSATHVMETQCQKNGKALILNRLPLFTSGLVLLFNLWGGKRTGLSSEVAMADVHKCMQMLKRLEQHTYSSRRLWDVLNGLISIGELPQPGGSHFTSTGKPTIGTLVVAAFARDAARESWVGPIVRGDAPTSQPAEDPRKDGFSPLYYTNGQANATSPAASSSSSSSQMPATFDATNGHSNGNGGFPMDFSFELPVHTADLGRVPFHHGFSSHFDPRYSISQQHQHQQPQALFSSPIQGQPQQQQTYFSDLLQQDTLASTSVPMSLPNGGFGGEAMTMNGDGFGHLPSELSLADYQQFLAAMSMPTTAPAGLGSNAPQIQPQPLEQQQAVAAGMAGADADVSMMFEDHMVEMWSSAPASLALADWGEYLNNMGGMDIPFDGPPQAL
ncbi:transcription factor [Ganoderma sinense ZZ0214-1]|uniref:Transcription factor n=1 Tax=Ganoderma sinense ZZ0214-1 TaxID=1077348 RepID=A0A2G8SJE2_9APHY|nr:transcription factor [Ganoderma sinense ZZ0214-1]